MSDDQKFIAKNITKVRISMKVEGMQSLLILGADESSQPLSAEQKAMIQESYPQHAEYLEFSEAKEEVEPPKPEPKAEPAPQEAKPTASVEVSAKRRGKK